MTRTSLLRLILLFAIITAITGAACWWAIHWSFNRATLAQRIAEMHQLTALVRNGLHSGTSLSDAGDRQLREAARLLASRITLIDGTGNVIFDSEAPASVMENHNGRPEVQEARRRRQVGSSVRFSRTVGETSMYVAGLVHPQEPNGLVIRISQRQTWPSTSASGLLIASAAAVCAFLMALSVWLLHRLHWVSPLRQISGRADRFLAGQWDQPALSIRNEPVAEVASAVDRLGMQVIGLDDAIRRQRDNLQQLVDSIPDPVLMTDAHDRIAIINPPAEALLEVTRQQAIGQKLLQVLNDESIVTLTGVNDAALTQQEIQISRRGQRRTYQATVRANNGGGLLMILRDVNTLAGAVQMKTDFVANASHELRTPLAAIKIAFETLRECYVDDPPQAERCIGIIDGHLHRLEEMLADLLDLSRVESEELKPYVRRIKTTELFGLVRATMQSMAQKKNVALRCGDAASEAPEFESDERLLNLVLKNLVENAIKFTPPGGDVTVSVQASRGNSGDQIMLSVSDTGIGIPPEHLDRVFERFYQVDSVRSGSSGRGTGLGLAIVKHAVAALGGSVTLESTVGKGTVVTCKLPQRAASAPVGTQRLGSAPSAPIIPAMSPKIIDGAALAAQTKQDVAARVAALRKKGRTVHLTAVLIGSTAAGELYAQRQGEACRGIGIGYTLDTFPADTSYEAVATHIRRLNNDPSVTGIMLHSPFPPHLDATELQYQIDPVKDVEGVNPANIGYVVYGHTLIAPCTALAVIELIKSTGVTLRGVEAVVVGASEIAGKPISLLLTEQMATVTLCHIATKDLAAHTRRAEVLVVAVGKAGLIGADHVREGAVVIDVGINRITLADGTKKTVGDVDFEAVEQKVSHITPVPGGVGPMTVAMLLKNTLRSAEIAAARAATSPAAIL